MLIKDFVIIDDKGYPTGINWDTVNSMPEFTKLKECEQSPKWHAEGNAFIHTEKVVEAMQSLLDTYPTRYNNEQAVILMASALFHDIGKGVTTEFKKGAWHAYGHEVESEKITRKILWDEELESREAVCSLVAMHMDPLNLTKANFKKMVMKMDRRIYQTLPGPSKVELNHLFMLKIADTMGSTMEDTERKRLDIEFLTYLFTHVSHESIQADIELEPILSDYDLKKAPYQKKKTKYGIIMIGVPGAGKNFYVENTLRKELYDITEGAYTMKVVSRDDIRIELGMCKENEKIIGSPGQETKVTKVYYEKVEKAIDTVDAIVFNDMNIKYPYRQKYQEFVNAHREYNWKWIYIYVESPSLATNINRRQGQIPEHCFSGFIRVLDWPKPDEYDKLIVSKQRN